MLKLRKQNQFGPRSLEEKFNLHVSSVAINLSLRKEIDQKALKRHKKKRKLLEKEEKLKPFEIIQLYIKYLNALPKFKSFIRH